MAVAHLAMAAGTGGSDLDVPPHRGVPGVQSTSPVGPIATTWTPETERHRGARRSVFGSDEEQLGSVQRNTPRIHPLPMTTTRLPPLLASRAHPGVQWDAEFGLEGHDEKECCPW